MAKNFNTNQALHLYVAKRIAESVDDMQSPGDIMFGVVKSPDGSKAEDIFFRYIDGDSVRSRTDTVKLSHIEYYNAKKASELGIKLHDTKVSIDEENGVTLEDLIGQHIQVSVMLFEVVGLDYSENLPVLADVYVTRAIAADPAKFYGELETILKKSIKRFGQAPFKVTSSADGLVISEKPMKWVLGKLENVPVHFHVTSGLIPVKGDRYEFMPWAKVETTESTETISGDFELADLERFAYGEIGDTMRESMWPYNYSPTMLIHPENGKHQYGTLTIQHFYCGRGTEVQESSRTLMIAGSDEIIAALKAKIDELMDTKADKSSTYSKADIDSKLSGKAAAGASYTKAEEDAKLAGKAAVGASYTKDESDSKYATAASVASKAEKSYVDTELAKKAAQSALDTTNAAVAKKAEKTALDAANAEIAKKASAGDVYGKTETYSQAEVNAKLDAKANASDVYKKTETYSQAEADGKFQAKQP